MMDDNTTFLRDCPKADVRQFAQGNLKNKVNGMPEGDAINKLAVEIERMTHQVARMDESVDCNTRDIEQMKKGIHDLMLRADMHSRGKPETDYCKLIDGLLERALLNNTPADTILMSADDYAKARCDRLFTYRLTRNPTRSGVQYSGVRLVLLGASAGVMVTRWESMLKLTSG